MTIDLNADVGEGMDDGPLLEFVTSVNVACGMHAGDPSAIDRVVAQAASRKLNIGAHPGYADRENFGRTPVEMSRSALENLVLYQVGAVAAFARAQGVSLVHVKPHGALYHQAAASLDVAVAVAAAVKRFDGALILIGPPGSKLIDAGRAAGLRVAAEAFADRRYRTDGTLVPRGDLRALLADPEEAAEQALSIAREGVVVAVDGTRVEVRAETLCLHGDTPGAVTIAARVVERLNEEHVPVRAMRR
jgi:UPF0271 protein